MPNYSSTLLTYIKYSKTACHPNISPFSFLTSFIILDTPIIEKTSPVINTDETPILQILPSRNERVFWSRISRNKCGQVLCRCGRGRGESTFRKGGLVGRGRWEGRAWEKRHAIRVGCIGSDIFISLFPWSFMAAVAPWTTITPTLNRLCEGTWLPDDPSCSRDNLKGTHGFAQAVRTHLFINAISPYFCFIDLDDVSRGEMNGKRFRKNDKNRSGYSRYFEKKKIGFYLDNFKFIV